MQSQSQELIKKIQIWSQDNDITAKKWASTAEPFRKVYHDEEKRLYSRLERLCRVQGGRLIVVQTNVWSWYAQVASLTSCPNWIRCKFYWLFRCLSNILLSLTFFVSLTVQKHQIDSLEELRIAQWHLLNASCSGRSIPISQLQSLFRLLQGHETDRRCY